MLTYPVKARDLAAWFASLPPETELIVSVREVVSGSGPLSSSERSRRYRASRRRDDPSRNVTASVTPPPTTPYSREGEPPETVQVTKSSEVQKNPENQKDLPGTAGARVRGENGKRDTKRHVASRDAAHFDPPAEWAPNETARSKASALALDLETEARRFRIWPGRRKPVKSWDRAFLWWLEKAAEFRASSPRASQAPQPVDGWLPGETPMARAQRIAREEAARPEAAE